MLELLLAAVLYGGNNQSGEYQSAHSKAAQDRKGYEPSLYRGKWYAGDSLTEKCRRAIMLRESHFNYRAKNPTSSASGAYQFLDNNWRDGLVWMFLAESKETKDGLRKDAKTLRAIPIRKWDRYWQDRAFYTAWRFGEGRHHWNPVPC